MDKEIQQLTDEPHLEPPTIAEIDAMIDILGGEQVEPDPADGWFNLEQIAKASGRSYEATRHRLRKAMRDGEIEKTIYNRFVYYRRRNGSE